MNIEKIQCKVFDNLYVIEVILKHKMKIERRSPVR